MARAQQWVRKEIARISMWASVAAKRATQSESDERGEVVPGDLPAGCLKFAQKVVVMRGEPEFILAYPTFTWLAYARHCNEMCITPNVDAYNHMVVMYNSWSHEGSQNESSGGQSEADGSAGPVRAPELAPVNVVEHPYREQDMDEWWRVREARAELRGYGEESEASEDGAADAEIDCNGLTTHPQRHNGAHDGKAPGAPARGAGPNSAGSVTEAPDRPRKEHQSTMAVAAQASLGAGSQPPTGGNQPREGSIVVTGQQAKDQKAPTSSQVEKVGGVKAKAADSQTKDNSGSGQAQGHDRSEDWQAQQDREAEEREQTERHYAYNAGWLDPAADSQSLDTATKANRSERPTNDPSSADTRDNTHSTKQMPDQGRQTKDTDAHAPRTPERRSNLHKTTNGTDKRGKDGRSPTKRRWPPGQTSAQGNARARAKHTQTTKSQDHPHPSDSATQQNRKPDTDAEGYQTQATSSDNGQAQTTSPDSWGAWGDSGTGDGSSGYWEESSVRSEEDMVRFTPVKGTAETTEGVPDDGTSGATDETSDGTHTNYPVMTHHAAHKCKSCTSGKWKLVNAPPILKRQVRQVIGAKGSGIKPMISELT